MGLLLVRRERDHKRKRRDAAAARGLNCSSLRHCYLTPHYATKTATPLGDFDNNQVCLDLSINIWARRHCAPFSVLRPLTANTVSFVASPQLPATLLPKQPAVLVCTANNCHTGASGHLGAPKRFRLAYTIRHHVTGSQLLTKPAPILAHHRTARRLLEKAGPDEGRHHDTQASPDKS